MFHYIINIEKIENEIIYDKQEDIQNFDFFDCVQSTEKRKSLFDKGIENAKIFVENNK